MNAPQRPQALTDALSRVQAYDVAQMRAKGGHRGPVAVELAATALREELHWSQFNRNTLNADATIRVLIALGERMDLLAYELQERLGVDVIDEQEPFGSKARKIAEAIREKIEADENPERDDAADRGCWEVHRRLDQ